MPLVSVLPDIIEYGKADGSTLSTLGLVSANDIDIAWANTQHILFKNVYYYILYASFYVQQFAVQVLLIGEFQSW